MTVTPTINELAQALRRGETSATDLVRRALRRIRELNPTVNAFALIDEQGAYSSARIADQERAAGIDRGPLHRVPVAVKDLVDIYHPHINGFNTDWTGDERPDRGQPANGPTSIRSTG